MSPSSSRIAVIGAGPAGLMAAETLAQAGAQVDVYDAMPSVGRKFLLAGRGGLNLTHSEPLPQFVDRYGARAGQVATWLTHMDPQALREWTYGLGVETFVGSSGRVFPKEMKAAPMLRAWLARLRAQGVRFHMRHRWLGWPPGTPAGPRCLRFDTPQGEEQHAADAVLLALGGASWARLGSDGAWLAPLTANGVDTTPLLPANCGFDVSWSEHFKTHYAGQPLKSVRLSLAEAAPGRAGECMISAHGIEGGLVYALSAPLRDSLAATGHATAWLDLLPGWSAQRVLQAVHHPRGARSWSSHMQSRLGLKGVKTALLRECLPDFNDLDLLARRIKALPIPLLRPRPIDEAISSAGGVRLEALTPHFMLHALPGVYCAGEMLDWEAPTGGYLLTACLASGKAAAQGIWADMQTALP
ncbi:TIGR03862 family flavoprotein [Bordetella holmesii]|uniref:Flavoprotein, TIGR03862 family n=2 Tax=Bordetella holmesii TaxID=35814 RepID=A0A158M0J6_9BORD|nr:TIGR03862 family flavoprotein [Bordetella holmesii]AMD49833.1 NAD(FAD)-utilizing dehydrogenase [Bordetella holmesii F627]AUL20756.1 NAD(FAD)-utilizing dehydrogenase [Bordetella holmesii]AUL24081.1 NAD(FAD)-utilizing dehydrogenase [Bordetella holmesii]AUL27408.1 NAD(FAD)-utilizing dehydrogenase [Bordetella holmesii]AUL30753.1 NAD(FAD)-utilizing dehydrogenase [Bordetella holmesii]